MFYYLLAIFLRMARELWNVPLPRVSEEERYQLQNPKISSNSQIHKCIKEIKCIRS